MPIRATTPRRLFPGASPQVIRRIWTLLVFCLAPAPGVLAQPEGFQKLQDSAKEWARLKDTLVQLESDWKWQKEWLEAARSATLDLERRLVAKKKRLLTESVAARESRDDQQTRIEMIQDTLEAIDARLAITTKFLEQLRPSLPPRLSRALELPYQTLSDPSRSISERASVATAIIDRCMRFNQQVTYSEELTTTSESLEASRLEVLYWGLSHAYALDRPRGQAYYGHPTEGGWRWEPQSDLAPRLHVLFAVYHGDTDPAFVTLPGKISKIKINR